MHIVKQPDPGLARSLAIGEAMFDFGASRHPASRDLQVYTDAEIAEMEAETARLELVDAGLFEDDAEQGDKWPVDLPEPVAESDLAWEADLSEIERWT